MRGPPRIAEILLRRFLPSGVVGRSILGDLRREFREICRSRSRNYPRLWYWQQAVRLSSWYAWSRIRGSGEVHRVAVGKENAVLFDLAQEVRYAVRRLARARGFTVTTLVTLALGIGVTAAVFALVNAVLIRPLPYHEADRLVAIRHAASRVELAGTGLSDGMLRYYREQNRVFEEIGYYDERTRIIRGPGEPERVRGAYISPSVLRVLGAIPQLGRLFTDAETVPGTRSGVIVSHDMWVRRFGADPDIIGRAIRVQQGGDDVVGVLEPGFHFPHAETQVWETFTMVGSKASLHGLAWSGIARLRPGVSREDAERDLQRLVRSLPDAFPDVTPQQLEEMGLRAVVVPLKDAVIGDVRVALVLLMGMVAFVLLITWANATNLTLVRAESRRREVAVERALGATDGHVARRCFAESFLLAVTGGLLGLALAHVAVEAHFGFAIDDIPRLREVSLDSGTLVLAIGVTVLTGVLLGAVSFVSATRPELSVALAGVAGRMTANRREQTGRRILVAGQVALALTLLIGSALMAQSFWQLKHVELGFEPEGALTFYPPLAPDRYDYFTTARTHDEILKRLRALPEVEAAEAASLPGFPLAPVSSLYDEPIAVADRLTDPNEGWPFALWGFATPGYFRAMGIPLLSGRTFSADDMSLETPGVILSKALAGALFDGDDPLGRRVRWVNMRGFPDYTVVGVAGNVTGETIREGPTKMMYFANVYPPRGDTIVNVVLHYIPLQEVYMVRTNVPPMSLVPAVRRIVREVDPDLLLTRVAAMEDVVNDSMARARLMMLLMFVGAGTALLLGVIGIYGVLSYSVRQRTSELGVRIALGANPGDIVRMVVRQGAMLSAVGIVAGLLAALTLTRFLGSLLYEVSPNDPAAFASMAVLLLVVALAASYLPARRAGRIDPVRALKGE